MSINSSLGGQVVKCIASAATMWWLGQAEFEVDRLRMLLHLNVTRGLHCRSSGDTDSADRGWVCL